MLRKLWILVFASALGAWAVSTGCDDGDGDGDADADTDADVDGDADGDGGDGGGGGDWPCEQGSTLQFRVTSLQISEPSTLAPPGMIPGIVHTAINGFTFLWLMEPDLTANTMTTGSGQTTQTEPNTDDPAFCAVTWNEDYAAVSDIPITVTGGNVISTDGTIAQIDIPVYSATNLEDPLLLLPLLEVNLTSLTISEDQTLIGTPGGPNATRYSQDWVPGGTLDGWISVAAAREVTVEEAAGASLCAILSGDVANDCEGEPSSWNNPPEQIGGDGELGYHLVATVGAAAVTIN